MADHQELANLRCIRCYLLATFLSNWQATSIISKPKSCTTLITCKISGVLPMELKVCCVFVILFTTVFVSQVGDTGVIY